MNLTVYGAVIVTGTYVYCLIITLMQLWHITLHSILMLLFLLLMPLVKEPQPQSSRRKETVCHV